MSKDDRTETLQRMTYFGWHCAHAHTGEELMHYNDDEGAGGDDEKLIVALTLAAAAAAAAAAASRLLGHN